MLETTRKKLTDMLASWPAWNDLSVIARGELLQAWALLLSSPVLPTQLSSEQSLAKQLLSKQQTVLFDGETSVLATNMVNYQVKQAFELISHTQVMPGPTGETNTLSAVGRGAFVIAADSEVPITAIVGFITCALVAGNSVILALSDQPIIADHLCMSLKEVGFKKSVVCHVPYSELDELMKETSIAGVAFIGASAHAMDINQSLASRQGQISPLIVETDLQTLSTLTDSYLIYRFISEKTQTINVTAVGGNAPLLALGNGDQ